MITHTTFRDPDGGSGAGARVSREHGFDPGNGKPFAEGHGTGHLASAVIL